MWGIFSSKNLLTSYPEKLILKPIKISFSQYGFSCGTSRICSKSRYFRFWRFLFASKLLWESLLATRCAGKTQRSLLWYRLYKFSYSVCKTRKKPRRISQLREIFFAKNKHFMLYYKCISPIFLLCFIFFIKRKLFSKKLQNI